MTTPYFPQKTWAEETQAKQPAKQTDILDMTLGQRFAPASGQSPIGGPQAAPQQRAPMGQTAGAPPGSTPMFGAAPVAPVNPFRPQSVAPTPQGRAPQLSGPANAAPSGNQYKVGADGNLTHSAYQSPDHHYGNTAIPLGYDYSPERSHNGYADISQDQYDELTGLGETNVRDNMESYVDENGQTRWRYATGAHGQSYAERYSAGTGSDPYGVPWSPTNPRPGEPGSHWRFDGNGVVPAEGVPEGGLPPNPNGNNVNNGGQEIGYRPPGAGFNPVSRGTGGIEPFRGGGASLRLGDAPEAVNNALQPRYAGVTNAPQGPRPGFTPPAAAPTPASTPDRGFTSNYREDPYYNNPGYGQGQNYRVSTDSDGYTRAPWADSLDDQVQSGLDNPSRYDDDLISSMWASRAAGLDDEFDSTVRAEDARLRGQGIRDSTFGGEAMIQRAAGRRNAKSQALQGMNEDVAATMSGDRSRAIADALAAQSGRRSDAEFDLQRRFGLDDRAFRNRQFDWSKYMDEEQFNAMSSLQRQQLEQWLIERGLA